MRKEYEERKEEIKKVKRRVGKKSLNGGRKFVSQKIRDKNRRKRSKENE